MPVLPRCGTAWDCSPACHSSPKRNGHSGNYTERGFRLARGSGIRGTRVRARAERNLSACSTRPWRCSRPPASIAPAREIAEKAGVGVGHPVPALPAALRPDRRRSAPGGGRLRRGGRRAGRAARARRGAGAAGCSASSRSWRPSAAWPPPFIRAIPPSPASTSTGRATRTGGRGTARRRRNRRARAPRSPWPCCTSRCPPPASTTINRRMVMVFIDGLRVSISTAARSSSNVEPPSREVADAPFHAVHVPVRQHRGIRGRPGAGGRRGDDPLQRGAAQGRHAAGARRPAPPGEGARVSFSGGEANVTDGPFAEAKEVVGGYWIIQARSSEEAVEWAKRCPVRDGRDRGPPDLRDGGLPAGRPGAAGSPRSRRPRRLRDATADASARSRRSGGSSPPRLIAGLARMVRDVGLAEDLAQDALVAALETWPRRRRPGQPRRLADGDGQAPRDRPACAAARRSSASTRSSRTSSGSCWRWPRRSRRSRRRGRRRPAGADLHLLPSGALDRGAGGADAAAARRADDGGDRARVPRRASRRSPSGIVRAKQTLREAARAVRGAGRRRAARRGWLACSRSST